MKTCTKCNLTKSVSEFHKNNRAKDKLTSACKKCTNSKHKTKKLVLHESHIDIWVLHRTHKFCTKCGDYKPVEDYVPSRQTKDGRDHACRSCANVRKREHERRKRAKTVKMDSHINIWRKYTRSLSYSDNPTARAKRDYRERNPLKVKAHRIVEYLIKTGKLVAPSNCSVCNSTGYIHGHHDDYSKPHIVRWLCALCHMKWHDEYGEGKT